MGKDPAFLFYPGNWLKGTQLMSRAHKGAYMDLLMAQFSEGHLSIEDIITVLGDDFDLMWESKLKSKFTLDDKGLYYNEKLQEVMDERDTYKKGRLENLKGKKKPHKDKPCGNSYEKPICSDSNSNKDIIKKANGRLNNALKRKKVIYTPMGEIKERPKYCQWCGKEDSPCGQNFPQIVGHHLIGYGNTIKDLTVIFVCRSCHGNFENKNILLDNVFDRFGRDWIKTDKPKNKYKDNVFLTTKEYNNLIEKHGEDNTNTILNKLDYHKGSNGKKYKSDYKAILNWVIDAIKKEGKYISHKQESGWGKYG